MPGVIIFLKRQILSALYLSLLLAPLAAAQAAKSTASPPTGSQHINSQHINSQQAPLAAQLRKIDLLVAEGSLLPARSAVEALLGQYPDDTAVNLSAARLYGKMGLSAFAIMQYEKVRQARPLAVEPLVALSKLHLENLSTELAVRLAEEAVAIQPTSREAQLALVSALLASQSVKQAQKHANILGRMYANDPEVEHALANVAQAFGDKNAIALMRKAVDARPAEQSWALELAELYSANQNYEKAKEILKDVLSRDNQSLKALEQLAHLNEFELNDYMAARNNYMQIKTILPDSSSAQAGMDRCLTKQGDLALNLRNFVRRLFQLIALAKNEESASDTLAPSSYGAQ